MNMAPYKLIALDIDGTVLTSRHMVAPETRRAVQTAMARGVRVTLATGRGFPSARAIAAELGLQGTPLVTHDGAYVADPATGRVLYEERIPLAIAREAVALLRGAGLNVNLLYPDVLVSNQRIRHFRWGWLHPKNWRAIAGVRREVRDYPHGYAPDLTAFLEQNPVEPPKMYVTGTPDRMAAGRALLTERLGDKLWTMQAGARAMEVTPAGVSKASGLRALAGLLGIELSAMVGIGDNYNDLEMIKQAGLGVAMGNAPEEIRRLANVVTRTNDEHGVAYAIERYVLGETA